MRDKGLAFPARTVTAGESDGFLFNILGADLHADRNPAHFPIVEFEAGTDVVAVIHLDANARGFEFLVYTVSDCHYFHLFIFLFENGNDDGLNGREARRQHQPLIVAVSHDDRADHASGQAPRCGFTKLQCVILIQVLNLKSLRKVLAKIMRGGGLQCAFILHHAFNGGGDLRAGKSFSFTLRALDDGQRRFIDRKVRINIEDAVHLFNGFVLGSVRRVTFLPIKLGGS